MATAEELAWAAGIVDGEGCVAISKDTRNRNRGSIGYAPKLTVAMTHRPTLVRLIAILGGGNITKHSRCALTRRQAWKWSITGRHAVAVLALLLPYLFTKRYEAQLVMGYYSLGTATKWTGISPELEAKRESLYRAVRAAKKVEWAA